MGDVGRETGTGGRVLSQRRVDAALAALAVEQHAVFGLGQLSDLGLSATGVHKRVAADRLHRVYRGVYSLVPPKLLTREGRWLAAVLACGPGAVLSHRSAAALLELRGSQRSRIDVTVPARSSRRHPGVDVHRSRTLTPADITHVRGIPCTTAARTQLDIAEVLDRRGVERAYDQAEILEVFDLRALQDQLGRNPGRHAVPVVRAVLDEHYIGRTPTWNKLEERFLALCRSAGIPEPEVNAWVVLPDGEPAIRVDFLWRAQRLIVETDGHETHRTRQSFERDRRNDQRLTAARWRPVRTTWRQIRREPEWLAATILSLMTS